MQLHTRSLAFLCVSFVSVVAIHAQDSAAAPSAAASKEILAESEPLVRSWTAGKFPESLPATVTNGSAKVRIIVDETGAVSASRVLKASDPAFGDAALAAIKQWTFSAGVDNGRRVAMCLDVPFEFVRGGAQPASLLPPSNLMPHLVPRTDAKLEDSPLGDYPESLAGRGLLGEVFFRCDVGTDGKASNLRVLRASHADLVIPAIQASPSWRFKPATQGDVTQTAELIGQVSYIDQKAPERSKVLAANGITAPDGTEPENLPQLLAMADPVFPYEQLVKGEGGSASVEFTVLANGVVRDAHIREATDPAFGAALVAAVETWAFSPAMSHGQGVDVKLLKRAEFKAVAPDAKPDDADWQVRLVELARANAISGGRGLDGKLTPVYRVAPANPSALPEGERGQAVVEFVIDRDGRARLPHVVSATKDEFGWAAVTAVSQWIFTAPTRGGKPTEVKVKIPVAF